MQKFHSLVIFNLILLLLVFGFMTCGKKEDKTKTETAAQTHPDSTLLDDGHQLEEFSVQVAAFAERERAGEFMHTLLKSRLPAFIAAAPLNNQSVFRVRVGPYATEEEAGAALDAVKKLGYKEAFITKENPKEQVSTVSDSLLLQLQSVNKKQLTTDGTLSYPKWSPSGREIAFYKGEKGKGGIYTVGTGGGYLSRIIDSHPKREILPEFSWSPSGKWLAFVAVEVTKDWERAQNIYIINKDGSGLQRLLQQERFPFRVTDLSWSPGGDYVAFTATYEWHPDAYQRVHILSVNPRHDDDDDSDTNSQIEVEQNQSGRLVGWQSAETLFMLTSSRNNHSSFEREIWSYNIRTRDKRSVAGAIVENCRQANLLANSLVYSTHNGRIAAVDVNTGQKTTLDSDSGESSFAASANRIVYLKNGKVHISDLSGNLLFLDLSIPSRPFTLSPDGARMCFAEAGDLYTAKLP
jgi:Tol biopolymer transport system component